MNSKPAVALFGASVRALAQSAAAAGFDVFGADLFLDDDLAEVCAVGCGIPTKSYPQGFREMADHWKGIPRVYTGGLENHPDVVEHFAHTGPLWGCPPESLSACRAPTALQGLGFNTPAIKLDPTNVPVDGTWLRKPIRSSGGRGIETWRGGELPADCVLQQRVDGQSCSASFLAAADRTVLIGAATQFVGEAWTGAPQFVYAGGVAPLDLTESETRRLEQVGETLRVAFGLRGLFGVDAIRRGAEWSVIEINPRPTASMELFELAGIANVFELHCVAFKGPETTLKRPARAAGKAILYAAAPFELTESIPPVENGIRLADRSQAGTKFAAGDPVATVISTGKSMEEVDETLKRGIARLRNRLSDSA